MRSSSRPEPVESVAAALLPSGAEAGIRGFETSTKAVTETAAVLGVSSSEIARTAIVLCAARPLAALVPGDLITLPGAEVLDAVDAGG